VRPPKLAIRTAVGVLAVALILVFGAISASAAPNPGPGTGTTTVIPAMSPYGAVTNNDPIYPPVFDNSDGPQTANIPTLAWVGEEVRLVACDYNIYSLPWDGDFQTASFNVEEWTGDQAYQSTPTFDGSEATNIYLTNTGGSSFFFPNGISNEDHGCVSANIKSLHAGLAIVKLDVNEVPLGIDCSLPSNSEECGQYGPQTSGGLDPTVVYSQQFVVIWMVPSSASLTEASVSSIDHPGTAGTDAPPTTFDQLTNNGKTAATGTCPATVPPAPNPSALTNCSGFLGDPTGNGVFSPDLWGANGGTGGSDEAANETPDTNNGLLDIRVTGSFPVEDAPPSTTNTGYFCGVSGGGGCTFTLPHDWAELAGIMATSSVQNTGVEPDLWDIHGGPTNTPLHHVAPLSSICKSSNNIFGGTTDAVDSCANNGAGQGNPFVFSRVFGDVTNGPGGTIGPFDPQAPNETLLSDGTLNSDDAPMPALPVTVSIGANGLGGLYGVSKYLVYSHDFNGSGPDAVQHPSASSLNPLVASSSTLNGLPAGGTGNLYNPFYSEYIPSTTRPINEASGVTGVYDEFADHVPDGTSGNDFPGFANGDTDPYPFWEALEASTTDTAASNGCLEYDTDANGGWTEELESQNPEQITNYNLNTYSTPDYPTSVIVYTDERGEAYVDYNPGNGFYWDGTADGNGACDLQNIGTLGTAAITAQVNFPYQSVPYRTPAVSNTVTKTVVSQWSKSLTVFPKGNTSGNNISEVVAHAQNINGTPFSGEEVCLQAPAGLIVQAIDAASKAPLDTEGGPSSVGGFDITGSDPVDESVESLTNSDCGYTGFAGNVAFDVSGSQGPTNVDIQGEFMAEHIFRDVIIPALGQTTPVSSTTPPTVLPAAPVVLHATNNGGGSTGSSNGGGGGSSSGPTTSPNLGITAPTASCRVASFHLYAKKGFAKVKIACTGKKSDSIVIRSYRANGKMLHAYRLTLKAGKVVKVYLGTKKAHSVKISL
jgi:hypothetical protein